MSVGFELFDLSLYQSRCQRVGDMLRAQGGGVAVIFSADEVVRSADTHYAFRQNSYFRYLTGFLEPSAALVLVCQGDQTRRILFCQPFDEQKAIWEGAHLGLDRAKTQLGMDETFDISDFDTEFPKLLAGQQQLFYLWDQGANVRDRMMRAVMRVRLQVRAGVHAPLAIVDLSALLDEMRLVKTPSELDVMRRAAQISANAHIHAMKWLAHQIKQGREPREYEFEAELLRVFRSSGADDAAYGSIVAAGANACVLHHRAGHSLLRAGELCLVDAACEFQGYAADITRTFPINGKFSAAQRAVYEIVLAAQEAAVAQTLPGASFDAGHQAAVKVLAQGLIDLGLLKGSLDEVLETRSYSRFYMHRTGHWLGMDVHDVGDYRAPSRWQNWENLHNRKPPLQSEIRRLEAGMVLTIEPGLYIRQADDVPREFWDIGIRIEDDALVTNRGAELMTRDVPVNTDEIEALLK
jgi:Xaa-Pro aminopeptidase